MATKCTAAKVYYETLYGPTTRKLRKDCGLSTHELRNDYGHITDDNYNAWHHAFLQLRLWRNTLRYINFFWPLP